MGMELLMARARLNHLAAAAPDITFVAACPPASVAANASISLALPAGAQAGDVLVAQLLHTAANNKPPTTSGPSGSIKIIAEKQFKWLDSTSIATLSVYLVPLAAADIANGSVAFGIAPSDSIDATGAVFRGCSQTLLDSANAWGVVASTAFATSSASFSAPGFSTVTDGVMLVTGAAISGAAPPSQSLNTPAGFTLGMTASVDYSYLMQVAYAQQPTHGAAAAAAYTYSQGSGNPFGWCAWQLALKRAEPAITLSAPFPATPHVGDTVNFDVTATLVDGATGTPTITVDQLPDGLTLGATTMVDATHYTATVSGTLTTVQDITCTFGATGGSVAATPKTHEFNVTEAGASVELVDCGHSANSGTTVNMSVPISVAAGDTILAVLSARQGATNTGPAGFTLVDDYIAVASTSLPEILVYVKTADGTETSVDASSTRASNGAALQVWKIAGGASIQTFRGGRTFGTVTAWSVGPCAPANDNSAVIAFWACGLPITEGTYGVDAAWSGFTVVDTNTGANLGTASIGWATQQQTTAAAATANFTASSGVQNPCNYMIAVSK